MNTKIIELLDVYIKLSGESLNVLDIQSDIDRYDKLIPQLTKKIEKLEDGINSDKYFDASSEIIDRNIEVSLKKKLDYLKSKLANLKIKNEDIAKKQKEDEDSYLSLNEALANCQSFIYDLSKFDSDIASKNIMKLIELENERYTSLANEIDSKEENREKSDTISTGINSEIIELEKCIQSEEERLNEVRNSLKNRTSYIDEAAKDEDLKELEMLKDELKDAQDKRTKLVNSVTYQSKIVREELNKDSVDKDKIMNILANISSRLNELPYLDVEDDTMLEEEYNQLCSQRDELMAVIENKKYNLKNKRPYEIRYEYLNQKLNNAKDIKEDYTSLLKFIINQEIEATTDNLLKLKEEEKELESAFSRSNKAVLQRKYVAELISSYERDLTKTLNKAKDVQDKIDVQEREIEDFSREIKDLKNEQKLHFDLENQAEKEQDGKMLEDIIKKIDYLNIRRNVGTTPSQVLDQIEMLIYENEQNDDTVNPNEEELDNKVILNYSPKEEKEEFTFEKVEEEKEEDIKPKEMRINNGGYDAKDETAEYSFSPIDNTGFVSFADAYDSTK